MRQFSVWNPAQRSWDYYQAQGTLRAGVIAPPPKVPRGHRLGLSPDEAARPLPAGARMIGRGPQPVGMVAGRQPAGAFGLEGGTLLRLAVWGGLGYLAWTLMGDRRRSKTRRFLTGK